MSARDLASLWERRLSPTSLNRRLSTEKEKPFSKQKELFPDPTPKPPPKRRRSRPDVSGKKPPVPPPQLSIPFIIEEAPLSDAAVLEAMSPVSSFVGSQPNSPSRCDFPPSPVLSSCGSTILEEIAQLRRVVQMWDVRIAEIDLRQRCLMRQLDRLNSRFSQPAQLA